MLNQCLFKNIEIASHKMSNFLWICYNVNNQLLCLRMPCIYSKHSLCLRILRMVDTGLILKWRKKYLPRKNVCDPKLSSINHNKTTFENTLGCFIAPLMGLTFSIVVFILELITVLQKYLNFQNLHYKL